MPDIQAREMAAVEAKRPTGNDEEEQHNYWQEHDYVEQLFEEELIPTMRYSFVVFIHTVFETHLRAFCAAMQRERNLPLDLSDVRGSATEQARIYLAKLVGVAVTDFPEWQHLDTFQKVRNCIVHHYGHLTTHDSRHKHIRDLATEGIGLSITDDDRISLDASFCQQHLTHIETFFRLLFESVGWKS